MKTGFKIVINSILTYLIVLIHNYCTTTSTSLLEIYKFKFKLNKSYIYSEALKFF